MKSFAGDANIWRLPPCSISTCRASFPVSNSDIYTVSAPPSHPAVAMARPHRTWKASSGKSQFSWVCSNEGFVGSSALDPTAWLALQINLSVLDGLSGRTSLHPILWMLLQSHGQAYEMAALRELQLQQHFHEPVIPAAAAQSLKAQLESSILALALWLPTKASLFTSFTTGKPHFPPLKIAKAASERFLKEINPTSIPEKQFQEWVTSGLFQVSLMRTFLRNPKKTFPSNPNRDSSKHPDQWPFQVFPPAVRGWNAKASNYLFADHLAIG